MFTLVTHSACTYDSCDGTATNCNVQSYSVFTVATRRAERWETTVVRVQRRRTGASGERYMRIWGEGVDGGQG